MLRRVTSTWRCSVFRYGAIRFSCLGATSSAVTTGSKPVTKPGHAVGALQYDNSKAGLQTVNVDHVQKVIMEATEGSAFYLHEQKREAARSERTKRVLEDAQKYAALPECEKAVYDERAAQTEKELRGTFSLDKRYVHVDMDMFYAAVEEKRDPSLTEIPFAVGSHSMLCTSNYVARKYGVRSGMPGFIAKKLCPFLRIVPPDFDHYKSIAADVRAIGRRYDVNFVSVGLDELTMEVSGYMTRHRLPMGKSGVAEVCERFRREVFQTTGLTCTAGAGLTSAVAKMASNVNKPDGQHVVELKSHAALMKHFDRIPLRTIPGIGYAQDSTLGALGLTACGDLLPKRALLCYLFREKTFTFYMSIALGLVRTHVERTLDASKTLSGSVRSAKRRLPKSISKEKTRRSICGEAAMSKLCLGLLADAHESLLREHLLVQTVTLYVKTHEFVSHSYARTLPTPCNNLETLWKHLQELLVPLVSSEGGYRLLGVRLTKFTNSRGGRPSKKDLTLQVKKQHKLATKLQSHLPSPPTIKKSTVIVAKPAKHRRVGA